MKLKTTTQLSTKLSGVDDVCKYKFSNLTSSDDFFIYKSVLLFISYLNSLLIASINYCLKAKSYPSNYVNFIYLNLFLLVFGFEAIVYGQSTVLISPTADGGFETASTVALNNWTAVNSTTDGWVVGTTPVQSSGSRCAFVSAGSSAWTYTELSKWVHLYKDVTIPANQTELVLSFKWKAYGEGGSSNDYDNLKVFWGLSSSIGTPSTTSAVDATYKVSGSGTTSSWYNTSSSSALGSAPTWDVETITLSGTAGQTYRLVFSWKSDVSNINSPPAALDEVILISASKVFTSSGTYTPSAGVCSVNVECWGGGGGGGGSRTSGSGGSGGGSGGYVKYTGLTVSSANSHTVTVGAAGTAGGSASGNVGGTGGNSSFVYSTTVNLVANGGTGGATNTGTAGSGGSFTCTGTGGTCSNQTGTNGTVGGASGGAGGTNSTSGSGKGGSATTDLTGMNGQFPGGGGGGAEKNGSNVVGGAGGAGLVLISWTAPSGASTAPVVTSPIATNSTSVSGTSTEADGTVIEVFNGASSLGTTTVSTGSWTNSGLSALANGSVITAKATACSKTVSSASSSVTVVSPEPTNQITSLAAGSVTTSAIPLTWTAAVTGSQAPDGYLINASTTSLAAISDPTDGTDPTNVTAFTSGSANKEQTTGSATSTTSFTGMTAGTMYYYKVYSYTNTGSNINFKTGSPATLYHATLPAASTSALFSSTATTSTTLSWTQPGTYSSANHSTLVFVKAGTAVTAGTPSNAPSTYTASTTFSSGTAYQGDASAYCVYKGDGTSVSISGLSENTTYHVYVLVVVDAQNSNSTNSYSSGLTGNVTTTCNPISGTKTISSTGDYATLTAALSTLTTCGFTGNLILELKSDYVSTSETFPITFGSSLGASSSKTITIRPATGATNLTITSTNTTATIDLNGGTYITFDGRAGGTGSTKQLTISNTSTLTGGTAIRFINEASNNTVKYCTLKSTYSSSSSGVVMFSTTTGSNGNDNNTIDYCDIDCGAGSTASPTSGVAQNGVYSVGSTSSVGIQNSGNTVSNCNVFNNFVTTSAAANINNIGVCLSLGNTDWTISGNSFYQTSPRTSLNSTGSATAYFAVYISNPSQGNNYTVSGNYIGGDGALAAVTTNKFTIAGTVTNYFYGVFLNVGSTTASSVQGNTIKNISLTGSNYSSSSGGYAGGANMFFGINITEGAVNIGNTTGNTIGNSSVSATSSANSSIAILQSTNNGGVALGIYSASTSTLNISNNSIGGFYLAAASGSNTLGSSFYGIYLSAASSNTLYNNTIGSTTNANSIYSVGSQTASNTSANALIGISISAGTNTIGGSSTNQPNFVQNINYASPGASTAVKVFGIEVTGGTNTISSNTVSNLSNISANTGSGTSASICGILVNASSTNHSVSKNTVYALSNNCGSATVVYVNGIYFNSSTGTNLIEKNLVYNISTTATSASYLNAIAAVGGTATYQNNVVRMGYNETGASSITVGHIISGILESAGTNKFYHNSIYVGGTGVTGSSASAAFRSTITASTSRSYQNNIFLNARSNGSGTGKHYAIYSSASANTGITSDYNDLYVSGTGGLVGYFNSADRTAISDWRTATSKDANSISSDPTFTSPTNATPDLSLTSGSPCDIAGTAIATVTDDYSSLSRSSYTPTDIGAYATLNILPKLTLENATSAIAVSDICASSTSVPIHAFNITGTNAGGTLTNFTFTTTGTYLSADVSNFKILYNTSNTTSGATTLATLSSPGAAGSKTFTAFSQAIGNATGYFWITMDVASGATNGGTITVSASASTDMTTTVIKAGSATASGTQTLKAAPTSSAGSAQSVCSTATLAATNPTVGSGTWTLVSGTGTITTSSAYNSGVTGLGVGANVFRWTVSNSPCTAATSDVTITLLATSTVFYSASTGDLNTLSNWWSNSDGSTGCNPLNFTTASTTYYITNRTTATIGAAWTVSGASSKVVLGQASAAAVTFTIPNNYAFTGTIDIAAASSGSNTLVINNTSIPTFGTLNAASTVKYNAANSQTISVATYGNLETGVESGTSNYTKTVAGILDINGNLTIGNYTTLNLSTYSHTLAGHMIRASSNSTFTATAGTITFDGTSIQHINVVDPTTATITPCDADISFGNIIINGSNVCLWYNKTTDKKINIVDFTVNNGKSVKFYSGPAIP